MSVLKRIRAAVAAHEAATGERPIAVRVGAAEWDAFDGRSDVDLFGEGPFRHAWRLPGVDVPVLCEERWHSGIAVFVEDVPVEVDDDDSALTAKEQAELEAGATATVAMIKPAIADGAGQRLRPEQLGKGVDADVVACALTFLRQAASPTSEHLLSLASQDSSWHDAALASALREVAMGPERGGNLSKTGSAMIALLHAHIQRERHAEEELARLGCEFDHLRAQLDALVGLLQAEPEQRVSCAETWEALRTPPLLVNLRERDPLGSDESAALNLARFAARLIFDIENGTASEEARASVRRAWEEINAVRRNQRDRHHDRRTVMWDSIVKNAPHGEWSAHYRRRAAAKSGLVGRIEQLVGRDLDAVVLAMLNMRANMVWAEYVECCPSDTPLAREWLPFIKEVIRTRWSYQPGRSAERPEAAVATDLWTAMGVPNPKHETFLSSVARAKTPKGSPRSERRPARKPKLRRG